MRREPRLFLYYNRVGSAWFRANGRRVNRVIVEKKRASVAAALIPDSHNLSSCSSISSFTAFPALCTTTAVNSKWILGTFASAAGEQGVGDEAAEKRVHGHDARADDARICLDEGPKVCGGRVVGEV